MVARRSTCGPDGSGRRRRVRTQAERQDESRISAWRASISAALIASKSICCRRSRSETVSTASISAASAARVPGARAGLPALRRRGGLPGGARSGGRSLAASSSAMAAAVLASVGVAPEQGERLVEQVLVLVAMHHAWRAARRGPRPRRPISTRASGVLGGQHLRRPDRQAGAAQQAGEVHDVGGEPPATPALTARRPRASATSRAASAPRILAISS